MTDNQFLEIISDKEKPLTYIIRHGNIPDKTTFLTPPEFKQQVGFIVYPEGGEVVRHVHHQKVYSCKLLGRPHYFKSDFPITGQLGKPA